MTWRSGLGRGFRKLAHTVISLGMHIFLRPSTHILSRALLIDSGHILLMRQRYGGHYILPGGHVDAGESIEHAVERECLEECGIHLKAQKVLGVIE